MDFNQAMLAPERTLAIRVGRYSSDDIKEATFNYGYISGDNFQIGSTCSGTAQIHFCSIITSFTKLQSVVAEIAIKVGSRYEWEKMGTWYINDIKIDRNSNTTTLELIDGMFKLNRPYKTNLKYPAQIRDVILEIAVKTGVTLKSTDFGLKAIQNHIETPFNKKDITFREVLGTCIQLLGYSAFFNRDGKLEIRYLTDSGITITADNYYLGGLDKSEVEYTIAGISCTKDNSTVLTAGDKTGRSLEIENEKMNGYLLEELYNSLKTLRYYPYSLRWRGHLRLQVGQWVTLITNKNETLKVPVLRLSFTFNGGLSSVIGADSKARNDTQYSYTGHFTKKITQQLTDIESEVKQQLEYANDKFNTAQKELEDKVKTGIEQAKAQAEIVKNELSQSISEKIEPIHSDIRDVSNTFDTKLTETKRELYGYKREFDRLGDTYVSKTSLTDTVRGVERRFEELRVGGRNLLRGTKDMKIGTGAWSTGTFRKSGVGTIENVDIKDSPLPYIKKGIKITSGATTDEIGIAQDNLYLEKGWITLTYYVKGTAGEIIQLQPFWRQGNSSGRNEIVLDGTWQKVTFSANNTQAGTYSIGYVYLRNRTVGANVTVIAGMVEYGNMPSTWREAPEDESTVVKSTIAEFKKSVAGQIAIVRGIADDGGVKITQLEDSLKGITRSVSELSEGTLKKSEVQIQKDKIVLGTGKEIDGESIASMFIAKPESFTAITNKFIIGAQGANITRSDLKKLNFIFSSNTPITAKHAYANQRKLTVKGILNGTLQASDGQRRYVQFYIKAYYADATTENVGWSSTITKSGNFETELTFPTGKAIKAFEIMVYMTEALRNNALSLSKLTVIEPGKTELIVDGTITGDKIITNTIKTAHLEAGAVTTEILAANAVTADKLKVDTALVNKLSANDALINNLVAKTAFINAVKAIDIDATRITSGVLRSTNGAMSVNLNRASIDFNQSATINFTSNSNAIVRRVGDVTGFLHFHDASAGGTYVGLGVTSHNDGIKSQNTSRFSGVRIFRSSDTVDQTEIFGDKIIFGHAFGGTHVVLTSTKLNKSYELVDVIYSVQALWRCWLHLNNIGWDTKDSAFGTAVINEYNGNRF